MSSEISYEKVNYIFGQFDKQRVLCIGDIMLDEFIYGDVTRISPDAPVPIVEVRSKESYLGGVGNVANNLVKLGAEVSLISIIGKDDAGERIKQLVAKELTSNSTTDIALFEEDERKTTIKTRIVNKSKHLLRIDQERNTDINKKSILLIKAKVESLLNKIDTIILSDYNKGCLTSKLIKFLIKVCAEKKITILVDSKKKHNFNLFKGANIIKPNLEEFFHLTGNKTTEEADIRASAAKLIGKLNLDMILLTKSAKGMALITKDNQYLEIQASEKEAFDVSGAGDAVISIFSLMIRDKNIDLKDSLYITNLVAGISISKIATSAVPRAELRQKITESLLRKETDKIIGIKTLTQRIVLWRSQNYVIGFTNGCFDLIHPGHVSLLEESKMQCDILIVAVNSNSSVKKLNKDSNRPIQDELSRQIVIASIKDVDVVISLVEETPMSLLKLIKPDVLIKGRDYTIETVVGSEFVQSYGGRVHLAAIIPNQSSTRITEKIKD